MDLLYIRKRRKVVSKQDYKYSKATAYDKDWTFEEMNGYLKKPQSYIRNKMAFAGLRKEKTGHQLFYILTKIQIIHYLYLSFPKQYNRILF